MLLLSDGTVMAQQAPSGSTYRNTWYKLTPTNGSYVKGTWTTLAPMGSTRLFYSTVVLRDGRVFVAGAEYGTGCCNAEIYDPLSDTWTPAPIPAGLINTNNTIGPAGQNQAGFTDSVCKILPNGHVVVAPNFPITNSATLIYNPTANTWSGGPTYLSSQNEAGWVKLPDDSFLTVDKNSTNSERYIPALNIWVNDGLVPVTLYDTNAELGAGVLLTNGRVLFLGGTGNTALYTPSGNATPGTWTAGPVIPGGLMAPDAAAAVMVDGKVLCAVAPGFNVSPTSFYEYDPATNGFSQVNSPTGGLTDGVKSFQTMMLDLPDGTVLYSDYGSRLYVYQPSGSPVDAGKPAISSITWNADGSLHLAGTLFNGISEGAAYGDDAQMDSNYPLVRMGDAGGNVSYARTYNWSSTSVMTSNRVVTTEFTLPDAVYQGGGARYSLVAVANGISSDPSSINAPVWVDFNYHGSLQLGTTFAPYKTISNGVAFVSSGGAIFIKPGSSPETIRITNRMTIIAVGGSATIGRP